MYEEYSYNIGIADSLLYVEAEEMTASIILEFAGVTKPNTDQAISDPSGYDEGATWKSQVGSSLAAPPYAKNPLGCGVPSIPKENIVTNKLIYEVFSGVTFYLVNVSNLQLNRVGNSDEDFHIFQ